jgi:ribosomal protein S20
MAKKGKTARPAVPKPESPTEARARLRALVKQIKKHLDEYEAHETLADAQLLRWLAGAAAAYLSKENKKSFEQHLGLKPGPGRPSKPGKHFDLAYKMFLSRSTKSPTRKSKKGRSTPRPWKEVGKPYGLDGESARKKVEQELPNITAHLTKTLIKKNRARRRLRKKLAASRSG